MKRCARCEREIPDSATICGLCDDRSVVVVSFVEEDLALVELFLVLSSVSVPVVACRTNLSMLVAVLLVVAGGIFAFVMLRILAVLVVSVVVSAVTLRLLVSTIFNLVFIATLVSTVAFIVTLTWNVANHEWLLNACKGVAFELLALKKVMVWQGILQLMLVIRCDVGCMQTFVYTSFVTQMEVQDENHSMWISFDGQFEVIERWLDSSDYDALFASDVVAFAWWLIVARTLRFGYTLYNFQKAVAEFHLTGLVELIQFAAKQCGWKQLPASGLLIGTVDCDCRL